MGLQDYLDGMLFGVLGLGCDLWLTLFKIKDE